MLERVGADELAEWQATYRMEPWGEQRTDWGAALIAWMVYQANRGKNAPDRPLTDFLPKFGDEEEQERPTAEQIRSRLMGVTAMMGGRIETA